jgi:hypothetical protein
MWEKLVITATEADTRNLPHRMLFSLNKHGLPDHCTARSHLTIALANPITGTALFFTATCTLHSPLHEAGMFSDKQIDARLQAARDGVLVVAYMHLFYSHGCPDRDPSQLILLLASLA